jgi:SAM-dependent methyltransferase
VADASTGAIRCDRVLQHLDDPHGAVVELTRCLRPGGRLVVADPDQQTLSIEVPGAPHELVDRVRRLRRDVGYRNGTYVSSLPGWLLALGYDDVTVDAFPLVLRDPDDAFGIATWVAYWAERHGLVHRRQRDQTASRRRTASVMSSRSGSHARSRSGA